MRAHPRSGHLGFVLSPAGATAVAFAMLWPRGKYFPGDPLFGEQFRPCPLEKPSPAAFGEDDPPYSAARRANRATDPADHQTGKARPSHCRSSRRGTLAGVITDAG